MREILEPKLKLVTKKSTPKRERYWLKHGGKPTVKRMKQTGLKRRLTRENILDRVAELGRMSDAAVATTSRREDLVRNLSFVIFQQRLSGALIRLKRQNSWSLKIPPRLERESQASAFKSQEERKKR